MAKATETTLEWQRTHKERMRMYKLRWYYKNRKYINMMFSKPKGMETDLADEWMITHCEEVEVI